MVDHVCMRCAQVSPSTLFTNICQGIPKRFVRVQVVNLKINESEISAFSDLPHDQITVPGEPQEVKVTPLNSTSIHVVWRPPLEKDRNGVIRGYHVHVQEVKEEVIKLEYYIQYLKLKNYL